MVKKIYTIGVYGTDEVLFFNRLLENKIDLFIDIRMRRGMRGTKYKYVNSSYLQNKLLTLGIDYMHVKELAPTEDIRTIQKKADKILLEKKYTRSKLCLEYVEIFKEKILNSFNFDYFKKQISNNIENILFFCVEKEPLACHRSLVSSFISEKLNVEVEHL